MATAPALRDALVAAFVRRTAPGAGLTSLSTTDKIYRTVVTFDRFLAALPHPPPESSRITPKQFNEFYEERKGRGNSTASQDLAELRRLLIRVDGLSDALVGRLASDMPKYQGPGEPKESYSRAELKRIADAARTTLREAAKRIRENRELLRRFRDGELAPGGDRKMMRRLELLDSVDRFADVPRRVKNTSWGKGNAIPCPWVTARGTVREIVSWLHLTVDELAAGAVLLAVMTGENPMVIFKAPSAHHRADGHTGADGTAIIDLRKPRRGRRAYMTLALSQVPDWISIPDKPEEVTARDELHTPFGLYVLLHDLTAGSRALSGSRELLTGFFATGRSGVGRGVRPIGDGGWMVTRLAQDWGLMADPLIGEDGKSLPPAPLCLRMDLLRLTYIELHQKPVAHTEQTAATVYLARNRGNVAEYRKVVADTLVAEVTKARTRGSVVTMTARDVERARSDPESVAAEHGLDPTTLGRMIAGELDTVLAACSDNKNSPHSPPGQPCRASFLLCLECECARALPRHLSVQVLVHDRLEERREQLDSLQWAQRFAAPHAQLADLIDQHDEAAVADARRGAGASERALADRFLNRELDLR
ncbi:MULTISPECIES: hypothetical protein [unclassified Streptomyces]|uniref:hypothetical protein n=1 Tax=unclassified Streptomyces TaxID=2593676 RepID=UPI00364E8EA9